MPQATDDDLTRAGKNERSRTLAKLYEEMAQSAPCTCLCEPHLETCPKGIWTSAARMAQQIIEE
jgi:hypothetical protein